jgi:hypothetical protein
LGFYKRNRSLFLVVLGAGLMATSMFWEYARMKPDYRYLVNPWSLRGFETTQGLVICAIGLAVMALAVPLSLRLLKGGLVESILVAGAVTAFGTLVPVFAGAPDQQVGGFLLWALALLTGLAAVAVVKRFLPADLTRSLRRLINIGVLAAVVVAAALGVYRPLFGDTAVPAWALVLVFMLTIDVLAIARVPYELASYRLLLNVTLLGWIVALVCAGAVRSTLFRLQTDNMGVPAEYRDIQITSGVLIAWVGGLLAFVGAVALWAHRRDELEEHSRAGRQLAVADLSATELEEAV